MPIFDTNLQDSLEWRHTQRTCPFFAVLFLSIRGFVISWQPLYCDKSFTITLFCLWYGAPVRWPRARGAAAAPAAPGTCPIWRAGACTRRTDDSRSRTEPRASRTRDPFGSAFCADRQQSRTLLRAFL